MSSVIGIDPGREKCGVAVVDKQNGILCRKVIDTKNLVEVVKVFVKDYKTKIIIIGNGTTSKEAQTKIVDSFLAKEIELICVDEYRTTDLAKIRYWQENPPRGWRKMIPTSMQVPLVPVDDYVAVILAERYLKKNS